jgi:hypothetical protein
VEVAVATAVRDNVQRIAVVVVAMYPLVAAKWAVVVDKTMVAAAAVDSGETVDLTQIDLVDQVGVD